MTQVYFLFDMNLCGIPDYHRFCHLHTTPRGQSLVEFPISTLRVGRTNFPSNRSGGTNDYAAACWHAESSAGSKEGAVSSRKAASHAAMR